MGTYLLEKPQLIVKGFWGGAERGKCLQIWGVPATSVTLTESEIRELLPVLKKWLKRKRRS